MTPRRGGYREMKVNIEILDDDTMWIDFKDKMIRIEKSKEHTNNELMITIHKNEDSDYHAKLIDK